VVLSLRPASFTQLLYLDSSPAAIAQTTTAVPKDLEQEAQCMLRTLLTIVGINHPKLGEITSNEWTHPYLEYRAGRYTTRFEAQKATRSHVGYWFLTVFAGPPPPDFANEIMISVQKAWKQRCQTESGIEIN
jgi:hypothetical protein